jgi:hypothetical protein
MTDREAAPAEVDALFALVTARYGARLNAAQLDGLRKAIEAVVDQARAVRAVRLGNADEPTPPFRAYRGDERPTG